MSHEIVQHVSLSLIDDHKFEVSFDDLPGAPTLTTDEAPPLGSAEGPNATALVAAAAANCLAASLLFCLRKTRARVRGLTAKVAAHVARNDRGRLRLSHLEIELSPELDQKDMNRLTRCEGLFEDFCIVSESLRRGIPVAVTVKTRQEVSVALHE